MSNRQEIQRELAVQSREDSVEISSDYPHVYQAERCLNCNVNVYDNDLYGPFDCKPHEPVSYTTTTGDTPVFEKYPESFSIDEI